MKTKDYSFMINYRVVAGSKREQMLIAVAKEYNVQPGCRLFDRMMEDFNLIALQRAEQMAEILRKEEEVKKAKLRLVAGE